MAQYLDELLKKAKKMKKEEEEGKEEEKEWVPPVKKKKDLERLAFGEEKLRIEKITASPKAEKATKVQLTDLREKIKSQKGEKKPQLTQEEKAENAEAARDAEEKSKVEQEIEFSKKTKVASYGNVTIYKIEGKPLFYYYVPVVKPNAGERAIINTIKEAATRLISIAPYRIRDPVQRRNVYKQKIIEIMRASRELNIPERRFEFYAEAVVREMVGYGLIDELVRDDNLEEIMVIGAGKPVYVFHREYEMMITNIEFFSEQEIIDLMNRIAREVGRRVDISSPLLDARLPDGSRVNATIPPASVSGATITIRKFRADPYSIIDLINFGTLDTKTAAFLWLCVDGLGAKPANMLITGGTGSGKTTLLNVLASFIPARERIITIEDTAELNLPLEHLISFEGRPPGIEEKGEVTLDVLTKNSLRMRPDRIIVGEVRHAEAFTLFTALNTGHDGCMGTVHANSPQETIVRVTSPPMNVPEIMLAGLDFIIVEHRIHDKKKGTIRRVTEIAEVTGVLEGMTKTQTIFERDPVQDKMVRSKTESNYLKMLQRFTGMSKKQLDDEVDDRKRVLDGLVKKDIHSMKEVINITQNYVLEK